MNKMRNLARATALATIALATPALAVTTKVVVVTARAGVARAAEPSSWKCRPACRQRLPQESP